MSCHFDPRTNIYVTFLSTSSGNTKKRRREEETIESLQKRHKKQQAQEGAFLEHHQETLTAVSEETTLPPEINSQKIAVNSVSISTLFEGYEYLKTSFAILARQNTELMRVALSQDSIMQKQQEKIEQLESKVNQLCEERKEKKRYQESSLFFKEITRPWDLNNKEYVFVKLHQVKECIGIRHKKHPDVFIGKTLRIEGEWCIALLQDRSAKKPRLFRITFNIDKPFLSTAPMSEEQRKEYLKK